MNNLISIADLSKQNILDILALAKQFKNGLKKRSLEGKVIASCFFEASTRTRLSFESAILKLGGGVIGFADSDSTSHGAKGESLVDTLKVINGYADALIIRHPLDGAARLAQSVCSIPVINAGDGANQHPSQTLLDLFSIQDSQNKIENISIGLLGDLKHGRTIHSLVEAAKFFNIQLYFIAPKELRMNENKLFQLKTSGIQYSFHNSVDEVIHKLDCLYIIRIQKERFDESISFDKYKLNLKSLQNVKSNFKILSPLPRLEELPVEIDATPYAYYFQQAQNGLYIRQALLDMILGDKLN
ncbi:MAG: aspartate carbamoyltransferase [Burkholderiales bacterium]|nr:aspartate carbamoyltransferase [Burkholderiales bacterium]